MNVFKSSMMKRLMAVAAVGAAVVACGDLAGVMTVNSALRLVDRKGREAIVPVGRYNVEIGVEDDGKELEIEIDDKTLPKNVRKLELRIPQGSVPQGSGPIDLAAAHSGQSVDLKGYVQTDVRESDRYRRFEQCSVTDYVRECAWEPGYDRRGRPIQRRVCRDVPVYRAGRREVESHSRTTTVTARARFLEPNTDNEVARIDGQRSMNETIVDFSGPCYRF